MCVCVCARAPGVLGSVCAPGVRGSVCVCVSECWGKCEIHVIMMIQELALDALFCLSHLESNQWADRTAFWDERLQLIVTEIEGLPVESWTCYCTTESPTGSLPQTTCHYKSYNNIGHEYCHVLLHVIICTIHQLKYITWRIFSIRACFLICLHVYLLMQHFTEWKSTGGSLWRQMQTDLTHQSDSMFKKSIGISGYSNDI